MPALASPSPISSALPPVPPTAAISKYLSPLSLANSSPSSRRTTPRSCSLRSVWHHHPTAAHSRSLTGARAGSTPTQESGGQAQGRSRVLHLVGDEDPWQRPIAGGPHGSHTCTPPIQHQGVQAGRSSHGAPPDDTSTSPSPSRTLLTACLAAHRIRARLSRTGWAQVPSSLWKTRTPLRSLPNT